MRRLHLALLLAIATGAVACNKSEAAGPDRSASSTSAVVAIDEKAAQDMFESRCAACHGVTGHGDGPGAAALTPKPRNYTDKAWQSSVSDEQIKKTIIYGGAAVGKSPIMPASPDLDGKPEVVDGLVKIVRRFGS